MCIRDRNYATLVPGKKSERTVFTMAKFTIPDDKFLVVELNEKNGGRHQSFVIENEDLVRANTCLLYTSIRRKTGGADGVYFTYTEEKPISFNPFYTDDYVFDVEKKDSIDVYKRQAQLHFGSR